MTDTKNIDDREILNILLKNLYGFPNTSETKEYYEESEKFNTYTLEENLLVQRIPKIPDFDNSGIVRNAQEVGLVSGDFYNYTYDINDKKKSSIVEDSTGTIRKYKNLILHETKNSSNLASWYKIDSANNNVLENSLQFNFNQYYDINNDLVQPYLYRLATEKSINTNFADVPQGVEGGNWIYNVKNGILNFFDVDNLSDPTIQPDSNFSIHASNNRPILTFSKYIGKRGVQHFDDSLNEIKNIVNNLDINNINNINNKVIELSNIDISNRLTFLENSMNTIYQTVDLHIDNTDISLNYLKNLILDISGGNFVVNIQDISNNLNNLTNNFIELSNNLYDLSDNLYSLFVDDISSIILDINNLYSQNNLIKGDIVIANSNIDYNDERIKLFENILQKLDDKLIIVNNKIHNYKNDNNLLSRDDFNNSINKIVYNESEILLELYSQNTLRRSDILLNTSNLDYFSERLDIINNNLEAHIKLVNAFIDNQSNENNLVNAFIDNQIIVSRQPLPNQVDLHKLNLGTNPTFSLADKYYYKDQTSRLKVEITNQFQDIINTILDPNYIKQIVVNNNTHKIYNHLISYENHPFTNYHKHKNNIPEYTNVSDFYNIKSKTLFNNNINDTNYNIITDLSGFLINVDSSNIPLSVKWGPMISNQGYLGDCYAFSASTIMSFSYSRLLKLFKPNINTNELHKISNYMLPSMIYLEKIFNRNAASKSDIYNPFSQGGQQLYTCYYYLNNKHKILEFQYNYPLLLTENNILTFKDNTKSYLINEFIDKVINDTPNDILSVAYARNFYNNILDPYSGTIYNLKYKFKHVLTEDMYNAIYQIMPYDYSFNNIDISNDEILLNKYKNIIINKIIELIDNDNAITIGILLSKNTLSNNTTFNIPLNNLDIEGGHAVTIVGYDNNNEIFIIQNSWGLTGVNNTGFYYLPYNYIDFGLKNISSFSNWFAVHFYIT
jgi:hypothetical protein